MAASVVEHYEAYSLFLEKKVFENFYTELDYNHQHEFRQWYSQDGSVNTIRYDLSPTLPTGFLINGSNANPNFLKPFVSATANSPAF